MTPEINLRNRYFHLSRDRIEEIDVFHPTEYRRGKDYFIDIFRMIEEEGSLQGLMFFLSEVSPKALPRYGKDVVLVLIADEHYCCRDYWPDLLGVIRTYPNWPKYLDGFPNSWARWMALLHFFYKLAGCWIAFGQAMIRRKDLAMFSISRQTLHVPLSFFARFRPTVKPMSERSIDYAFLGSVEYHQKKRKALHRIFQPPKLASRNRMIEEILGYGKTNQRQGVLQTTGDFDESVCEPARYIEALENCKISICPRGANPETYRFFESCATGCVVLSEPLPDAWFYHESPAIVIRDWKRLPAILDSLLGDSDRLQTLSRRTRAFWEKQLSEKAVANRIISFLQERGRRPAKGAPQEVLIRNQKSSPQQPLHRPHGKISIVIINHNYGEFVCSAIVSALAQTWADKEVIVVDDGSTDDSRDLIFSFGPRIQAIFQEKGGHTRAVNTGFAASAGKYVVFLDADDLLYPVALASAMAAFRPGDVKVQFQLATIDRLGVDQDFPFPYFESDFSPMLVREQAYATGWYPWTTSSGNLYSREYLEKVFPLDSNRIYRSPDSILNKLAPLYGGVRTLRQVLGAYRVHGRNKWAATAATWTPQVAVNWLKLNQQLEAVFIEHARQQGVHVRQPLIHPFQKLEYEVLVHRFAPHEPVVSQGLLATLGKGWRWFILVPSGGILGRMGRMTWLILLAVAPKTFLRWALPRARGQINRSLFWKLLLEMTRQQRRDAASPPIQGI